ncbi:unnamed protein product [Polarella glacialis]|uniref:NmrA-like domain-containing protein n=1 Tax=Polarella glacialis TaxID=89957 RepID=A0A813GVY5_POLGL|nr:unnamed protein product [Polarella glacialis]
MNAQEDMPIDFTFMPFYYQNFFGMKPQKGKDGEYALYLPLAGKPSHMVSVDDCGIVIAPLFGRLPTMTKKTVPWSSEKGWPVLAPIASMLTADEIAEAFSEVCLKGAKVIAIEPPVDGWVQAGIAQGTPELVAKDFGNMFGFFQTDSYCNSRGEAFLECKGKMTDFKAWLETVKAALYPEVWAEAV